MTEKIYLVDGSGYIFRAFYAVPPLTNSEGFPTNALLGFLRMLLRLMKEAEGGHVVVVFDAGRKTFRSELYPEYKANRSDAPEELVKQFPYFREFSRALGFPTLEVPGFEADDIIATLASRCEKDGHEVVVVSGDKDLLQLVSDRTVVWDTMKEKVYRDAEVKEKFGVPPSQVVEVLGLMGDDSDNVPGLNGCGPKTATQLIERYGTVENVLASTDAILNDSAIRNRKKLVETLLTDPAIVRLSRRLVEVDRDTPVPLTGDTVISALSPDQLVATLTRGEIKSEDLSNLVTRFEFGSLVKDLSLSSAVVSAAKKIADTFAYQTVLAADFDLFMARLEEQEWFALDLETTSLDPLQAQIVGVSFCWSDTEAFYLPVAHTAGEGQVAEAVLLARLKPILADPSHKIIGQNLKYDLSVLLRHGLDIAAVAFDTMLASYVLAPDKGSHNMTVLAREYLGRPVIEFDELVAKGETFASVSVAEATRYGCQDAHIAWQLRAVLAPKIESEGLQKVFSEIEMPLVSILARMELAGVALDTALLSKLSVEFAERLAVIEKEIYELAKGPFNINSPKQLGEVLFERLGLPTKGLKKTKTGISTDSSVLEKLAPIHPLPAQILRYRSLHKLKSTYVDALPAQISSVTGRLHTRFNQAVTGTGRLSSSDPNLQNIPIQTAEGRRIRETFIGDPSKNSVLISADYSQIELRILAHISGDPRFTEAFKNNVDVHSQTAREIMHLAPDAEITPELRRLGKTINFGVVYGMGPYRLARDLEIPVSVATQYIESYFERYQGIREFFDRNEADADSKGFVTTMFGRKRILAQIDTDGRDQGFARRVAMNAPIQGSAADLMKLAMIKVDALLRRELPGVRMLLQIHDELVFECEEPVAAAAAVAIKREMEQVVQLAVPLVVDIGWGKNWDSTDSH